MYALLLTSDLRSHSGRSTFAGRASMAFELRSFLNRSATVNNTLSECLLQPSNPAPRPSLDLLRPAPLRCGDGKGQSEQCVAKSCTPTRNNIKMYECTSGEERRARSK